MTRTVTALACSLLLLGGFGAAAQEEPLDLDLEERVDVRLVLVDFLVTDRDGRTVPDLERDDFFLLVDYREHEIATLDVDCPAGAAPDPRREPDHPMPAPDPTSPKRRIVLVFDYEHMTHVDRTFEEALRAIDRFASPGVEHMIVSLATEMRIELPFTEDTDELRWTLHRMRRDRGLFASPRRPVHTFGFFRRVEALFDILEPFPGRKAVVLFSGPFVPDGFFHDPDFRTASALATTTRTALYPVDTGGLRVPGDPKASPFGGPPGLRRLALETGGRIVADTNDIGLAFAAARRDAFCTYTLGFYDEDPDLDRERHVAIRLVEPRRRRVVHPENYVVRSADEARESRHRTATLAPTLFESASVTATVIPVAPAGRHRWRALVGTSVPSARPPGAATGPWRIETFVRRPNGTEIRSFETRVAAGDPLRSVREITLPDGEFVLGTVVSGPDWDRPRTASRPVSLPPVPRHGVFLVGPVVGTAPSPGSELELLDPALAGRLTREEPHRALTWVCDASAREEERSVEVHRTLRGSGSFRRLPAVRVRLDGGKGPRCAPVLDELVTAELAPGPYELGAAVGEEPEQRASFDVVDPP